MQTIPSNTWTRVIDRDFEIRQVTGENLNITFDGDVLVADADIQVRRADGLSPAAWLAPAVRARSFELVWFSSQAAAAR